MTRLARISLAVAVVAAATVGGAWVFQFAGYAPCELCLKQRIPYYVGAPTAALAFVLALRDADVVVRVILALLAFLFVGSAIFGGYHVGVEWGLWPGPSDCTGDFAKAASSQDFLKQLQTVQVVRCDVVALRVLGLSLAGWNVLISVGLAMLAGVGAVRGEPRRRSRW